ncbi:4533_t:CDS:2, partial [Funneliformis mosseae]
MDIKVISELFSDIDGNNDDNASEEDNKRAFKDNALKNFSNDSDEGFQLNFDVSETELEKNNF